MSLRAFRDYLGRIGKFLVSIVLRRPGDFLASRLFFFGLRPGYVQQSGMLILTDVAASNKDALNRTLEDIRTRLINYKNTSQNISFYKTETVHYAAWIILPGLKSEDGKSDGPAKLAFETNYDGNLTDHLQDLVTNCRRELDEVYSSFAGYPPQASKGPSVEQFLLDRYQRTNTLVNATAYHVALQGRSLKDIRNAIAVYEEAKKFVDNPANSGVDPKKIRCNLIDQFKDSKTAVRPERFAVTQKGIRRLFAWNIGVLMLLCLVPPMFLSLRFRWLLGLKGLSAISMTIVLLLCFMPLLYFLRWLGIDLIARYFELKEEQAPKPFDPLLHQAEYAHLDLGHQNHLCTYTTVKPCSFRNYVIRRAFWLGVVLFKYFFILGKLDQITTVHFGRWTLIGDQLLFYGNYDGSWSSYLTDFADEAWGVNLIWGNTIGFPATKFIVGAGARNLELFQAQAAEHYAPAPFFYSAYRDHSLVNLIRYLEFRDELFDEIGA